MGIASKVKRAVINRGFFMQQLDKVLPKGTSRATKLALRDVFTTSNKVTRGSYGYGATGCPITQLETRGYKAAARELRGNGFIGNYDNHLAKLAKESGAGQLNVLELQD